MKNLRSTPRRVLRRQNVMKKKWQDVYIVFKFKDDKDVITASSDPWGGDMDWDEESGGVSL